MAELTFSILIDRKPEIVFPFVGDLLRHREWATDPIQFEALSPDPIQAGSHYHSVARFMGRDIAAELVITEYQPPQRFAFTVRDQTGSYEHQFRLQPHAGGTLVERRVLSEDSLVKRMINRIIFPLFVIPESKKALQQLKLAAEHGAA